MTDTLPAILTCLEFPTARTIQLHFYTKNESLQQKGKLEKLWTAIIFIPTSQSPNNPALHKASLAP